MMNKVKVVISDNTNAATATTTLLIEGLEQKAVGFGCLDHASDLMRRPRLEMVIPS